MKGTIGEVRLFAGTFEPENWLYCDGKEVEVVKYKSLFSVIGTKFGGNGVTHFALPKIDPAVGAESAIKYDDLNYIICTDGDDPVRG